MLTTNQINELEKLIKETKSRNQSLRIAEVTKVIYPIEIKSSYDTYKKPNR